MKRLVLALGFALACLFPSANRALAQGPMYRLGSVAEERGLRGPLDPPEQQDPTSWRVEEDITLHFEAHGAGRPMLIVHGGPGIPHDAPWTGLEDLREDFRIYDYHQRGCGNSTRPFDRFEGGNYLTNMVELERTLGIGAQVADIERIRRILGEERLILVGHSFGGFLATLYAAEFPDHVEKLVLVAPAGLLTPPDEERDLFKRTRARLPAERQPAFDEALADYFDFGTIFSKSEEDLVQRHLRMGPFLFQAMGYDPSSATPAHRPGGWGVYAQYFSLGTFDDFSPALDRIRAKTLILHGQDDDISIPGTKSYAGIAGARIVEVGRDRNETPAGHFVFADAPEAFAAEVRRFLGQEETSDADSTPEVGSGGGDDQISK